MAKKFVQTFPYHLTEKPKCTFWLTQCIGNQEPNQNPVNIPPYFDEVSDCELTFNCRSQIFTFLASLSTGVPIFDLDSATKHTHTHTHTHTHVHSDEISVSHCLQANSKRKGAGHRAPAWSLLDGGRDSLVLGMDLPDQVGSVIFMDNVSKISAPCVPLALLRTCVHVLSCSVVPDSLQLHGL